MSVFMNVSCRDCPMEGRGLAGCEVPPLAPDVVFVGEAPGRVEAEKGRPFVGPSGRLLRSLVEKHAGDLRVAYINVVSCRPPDNKLTKEMVEACDPLFRARLERLGTKPLYVALGATAARALGLSGKMGDLVDVVHQTPYGEVYVAYHPAYVLRRGTASTYEESIRRALAYAATRSLETLVDRAVADVRWRATGTGEEVSQYVRGQDVVVFDIETFGGNPFDPNESGISAVAVYSPGREVALVAVGEAVYSDGMRRALRDAFRRGVAAFHNGKFDVRYLVGKGLLDWDLVFANPFHDSKLAMYVVHEDGVEYGAGKKGEKGSHGLKPLTARYLGVRYGGDGLYGARPGDANWEAMLEYAARDAVATHRLLVYALRRMDEHDLRLYDFLRRVSVMVAWTEACGVVVDLETLRRLEEELSERRSEALERVRRACGLPKFNPRSTKQVARVLYELFNLPVPKHTDSGAPSTDAESLEILEAQADGDALEFISALREYRAADKIISTYIEGWRKRLWADGRLHPSFHETGTVTGRLSSSGPNLQNVAKHSDLGKLLRRAVVAPPGHRIVEVDGSQMEVRVFAALSGDRVYTQALLSGEDVHAATARSIFGEEFDRADPEGRKRMRTWAKRVTFGVLYGMGPELLAKQIGTSVEEAERILGQYYEAHLEVWAYRHRRLEELVRRGYVLTPQTGRKRRVAFIPPKGTREFEELKKHIWNAEVQGLASDVCLMVALRLADRWRKRGVRFFAFVHDSIVAYVPEELVNEYAADALRTFREVGREVFGETIPFVGEAEVGYNWAEMEPWEEGNGE